MIPGINVALSRVKNGGKGKLDFSFDADPSLIGIPYVAFASPVHAELGYEIGEDGAVRIGGEISFRLEGSCSRCLERAAEDVRFEVSAVFVPGVPDEEEGEYSYSNGHVELGGLMRESILFALPAAIHCEACKQQDES